MYTRRSVCYYCSPQVFVVNPTTQYPVIVPLTSASYGISGGPILRCSLRSNELASTTNTYFSSSFHLLWNFRWSHIKMLTPIQRIGVDNSCVPPLSTRQYFYCYLLLSYRVTTCSSLGIQSIDIQRSSGVNSKHFRVLTLRH